MKRIAYILTALLFLLCACQPTPEKEFIVSHTEQQAKPTENGGESVAPQGETDSSVIPARWEETVEIDGKKIIFDTDIRVDDAATHPIYKVERAAFDGETCLRIIESAFGTCEWRENELSRDDILREIEQIRLGDVTGYNYRTNQYISTPFENEGEMLAPLIRQLQVAPTEDTFLPLTAAYLNNLKSRGTLRTEDGKPAHIVKLAFGGVSLLCYKYYNPLITPESWVLQGEARADEPPHALENVKITEEEAIAAADAFVARLGRDDLRCAWGKKARMDKGTPSASYTRDVEELAEGYWLFYSAAPKGCLPSKCDLIRANQLLKFDDAQASYSAEWGQEILLFFVTEEGILSIEWSTPTKIVGIVNADAALMPFEQMQERIRTMISYSVKGNTYLSPNEGSIYITDVCLSAVMRPIKDDPDHAELAPAWVIELETDLSRRLNLNPYYLVIDATDGSVIR